MERRNKQQERLASGRTPLKIEEEDYCERNMSTNKHATDYMIVGGGVSEHAIANIGLFHTIKDAD